MVAQWNIVVESEQKKPIAERRKLFPKTLGLINSYHNERKKQKNVIDTLSQLSPDGSLLKTSVEQTTVYLREQSSNYTFIEKKKINQNKHETSKELQIDSPIASMPLVKKGTIRCRRCGKCRVLFPSHHSNENVKGNSKDYCQMETNEYYWIT